MSQVKRVAIVGAGVSGLTALKSCLEEGLEPVCFERCEDVGGVWNLSDSLYSSASAKPYPSMVSNTSKMMSCLSDFLFSKETPAFMTPRMMNDFLISYANHFNLRKYIHFKTKVNQISKARDYDETGNWEVAIEDDEGKIRQEVFDAVMICTGNYSKPKYPDIEGMDCFKGKIEHALDFRTGEVYKNMNVVVIGNSVSAGDLSTITADYAKQVYMSVGPGCIVIRRFDEEGCPWDMQAFRRCYLSSWTFGFLEKVIRKLTNLSINHDVAGIHGERDFTLSVFMVTDDLNLKVMSGKVKVVGRVVKMSERSVHIDDGTAVDDVDVVMFATGYHRLFPFLDSKLIDSPEARNERKCEWYKFIFPIYLKHSTLAFIGMARVEGPHLPFCEMQSRFAARVFSGKLELPPKDDMRKDIDRWNAHIIKKFSYYKQMLPYLPYVEELAEDLGIKPSFWRLIWRHPRLAYSCTFGPASPVQYRLVGPHSNTEAVNHSSAIYENTFCGVTHRRVPPRKPISFLSVYTKVLISVSFAVACYYAWHVYFI